MTRSRAPFCAMRRESPEVDKKMSISPFSSDLSKSGSFNAKTCRLLSPKCFLRMLSVGEMTAALLSCGGSKLMARRTAGSDVGVIG